MNNKSFNQWLPECEADLRDQSQRLYNKYHVRRLGLEPGDLFNDVVAKLAAHNHPVDRRGQLFGLMNAVTLNMIRDLGRKKCFRDKFFTDPTQTGAHPLPSCSVENVATKQPSPADQVALRDEIEVIGKVAGEDPELGPIFEAMGDLIGLGERPSTANIARHLHLQYKQVARSVEKLQSLARGVLMPTFQIRIPMSNPGESDETKERIF